MSGHVDTVYIRKYSPNMHGYIGRDAGSELLHRLACNPAVALLGPRQCGKSTLAKHLIDGVGDAVYLDLERLSDRNKLRDPEAFFGLNTGVLICLDEIQRVPDLFPVLRSVIDEGARNGQFLCLGSASRDLIRQNSETLAERITFLELTPLTLPEVSVGPVDPLCKMWLRGGFPRSFLAGSDRDSFQWRLDFMRTYLERDIPQLGIKIASERVQKLWHMCAHLHGQLLNYSKLAGSLGVDDHTVRNYLELLCGTFMVRFLRPVHANLKKRLVKAPKIYIRDTGLLHALLGLEAQNELLGHPVYGDSWEGFVTETIFAYLRPSVTAGFYRTASGAEIDLILEKGAKRVAIECKASSAPRVQRGFWNAMEDLNISKAWVISPVDDAYPMEKGVTVTSLMAFLTDPIAQEFLQPMHRQDDK